jgi:UDP-N-acetylmuramoyl-L-alanine---L-glutamate ligase
MISRICNLFENKKILLLGFGREGKSTYRFIRKQFPDMLIGIYDKKPIQDVPENTTFLTGESFWEYIPDYDIIIKSPGIVLDTTDSEVLRKFTCQTDLFLESYRTQTIGITGTKGKSTTTALLYHILRTSGRDALLVGNIGIPVFDVLEEIGEKTMVVFELSSHQLQYVTHSPHIGVLLNIFQEHLDHYGTFDKYKSAKENIYKYQQKGDLLLYNEEYFELPEDFLPDKITISNHIENSVVQIKDNKIYYLDHVFEIEVDKLLLKGPHNLYNVGAAYVLARNLGVSDSEFRTALRTFKPLPHRMEYIGEIAGVKYYNDSISTICETTIQGVNSLTDVDTVILGGMDRGISYQPLVDFLLSSKIRNIILMPDTGYRILKMLEESGKILSNQELVKVANVAEAVTAAKKLTKSGTICLFSPAAASYGFFKDFEERGEVFKSLVLSN